MTVDSTLSPRPARVRALHVGKLVPPPYAGIESHVDTLLRALQGTVDCTLIASEPGPRIRFGGAPTPYHLIRQRSFGRVAAASVSPSLPWTVQQLVRSGPCNLLHLHTPNPLADLSGLLSPSDLPVVMSWHSDIVRQKRLQRIYGPIQRASLRRCDRVIVATPMHYENSTQLHDVDIADRVRVVPYGIDFSRFAVAGTRDDLPADLQAWIGERRVILTVGRHIYYKGFEYLIDAMGMTRPDSVLLMVGTGPLTPALQSRARALGIEGRIRMLGEVDERLLPTLFHACDVFTLPSVEPSEAFGIASAEAMSCGKPVVVCELGTGVNYLNRHGQTGLTVPARDVAALADALDTLLRDDSLRVDMGRFARQWVQEHFSIEAMRREMLKVYAELLPEPAHAS
jgi:glycosyltransferase involved in cell wall biosynthesis